MKVKKEQSPKGVGLLEFFKTLPKYKLPWLIILAAFLFNVFFNSLLLKLPATTAALLSGTMTGAALWGAIWYYVLMGLLTFLQSGVLQLVEYYSVYKSRKSLWRKMLRTKVRYYDENDPTEMLSAVTTDISSSISMLVNLIVFILPDTYYVVAALFQISNYHSSLMLAELAIFPLKYIQMVVLGRFLSKAMSRVYERIGVLTGYLAERINHLSLIKTFSGEKKERENGLDAARKLYKANMGIAKMDCANQASITLIMVIEKIVVMMAAVVLLRKGLITIQQWIAFFMFAESLSSKFDGFIVAWLSLKTAQGSAARTVRMMNAENEPLTGKKPSASAPAPIDLPDTSVEFDNVSFAYGEHQALKGLSFTVPSGSSVCIVGMCGSGKTTTMSLAERFYTPASGEIRLGGKPISEMSLEEYRNRFSYIQQGADIFSGTAREALTYGIPREIPDEEILEACRASGFMDYIKNQPLGLDAPIASGGSSLSGGQNQRLVLAREFLRNGDIILMDEPTSALDMETSGKIRKAIAEMFRGKTRIVVTHDLDVAQDMDAIIVLDGGVCVGAGTAESLKESCPIFREMLAAHEAGKEAAE